MQKLHHNSTHQSAWIIPSIIATTQSLSTSPKILELFGFGVLDALEEALGVSDVFLQLLVGVVEYGFVVYNFLFLVLDKSEQNSVLESILLGVVVCQVGSLEFPNKTSNLHKAVTY